MISEHETQVLKRNTRKNEKGEMEEKLGLESKVRESYCPFVYRYFGSRLLVFNCVPTEKRLWKQV
jgi:hypothetical protein